MQLPATSDTIVAVSTAWSPSAVGVLRLSGPAAFDLAARIGARPPQEDPARRAAFTACRLEGGGGQVPALAFWFREPRSYTGQNVVELHLPGCLPLLRVLAARLVELGGRRALPGEFTLRAFLNGKLTAADVERVQELIHASDSATARVAARGAVTGHHETVSRVAARLEDLLSAVEAGIDFAEEEAVRFITRAEARGILADIEQDLRTLQGGEARRQRGILPHVTLAGLPNAGKSTLFNALVGRARAIVSPVLGTTRDVLSAELVLDGTRLIVQDSAGLTRTAEMLEAAATEATLAALGRSDLVLWVHPRGWDWSEAECAAALQAEGAARLLVLSKADEPGAQRPPEGLRFIDQVVVSAARGEGLSELRAAIVRALSDISGRGENEGVGGALEAVVRASNLVASGSLEKNLELVALELRSAHRELARRQEHVDEEILGLIFSRFCIGK